MSAMAALHRAAADLVASVPALAAFASYPGLAPVVPMEAEGLPALAHLAADFADVAGPGAREVFTAAVLAAAPEARWQQTYTEAEVGADFLARYGWFELAGPAGHVRTDALRAYVAYWGRGLFYDWHEHEAEELYFIASGSALFRSEAQGDAVLGPGDTRLHAGFERHAMTTLDAPILTLVLWRGAGLDGVPTMSRKS
jgi:hypothetical protein